MINNLSEKEINDSISIDEIQISQEWSDNSFDKDDLIGENVTKKGYILHLKKKEYTIKYMFPIKIKILCDFYFKNPKK